MIDQCDIVQIYNQLYLNKDIVKYYYPAKLNNDIISIKPTSLIYYNKQGYEIYDFQIKYAQNGKIIMIYCLYYPRKYSQVNFEIKKEEIIDHLRYFMI